MAEDQRERRAFSRASHELRVDYTQLNAFFSDYTHNISRGGTFIRTDRPLPVGEELTFTLTVPTVDQPLELRGVVRWTIEPKESSTDQPAGMGISFVYTSEEHRQEIHEKIENLMEDRLGAAAAVLLGQS